jgi:hypothetical protein
VKVAAKARLSASKLTAADPVADLQNVVVDETASAPWFPTLRNVLGQVLGGLSKFKIIQVTPNSVTLKLRAQGVVLDSTSIMKFNQLAQKFSNLEFAIFTQNQRMYILAVER